MNRSLLIICILYCVVLLEELKSEIDTVTVNWNSFHCQSKTCVDLLTKEFKKINGVKEITIDTSQGYAYLKWKENIPFSSVSIKTAMKMVGLSWQNIRVKVAGKIRHEGNKFFIVSSGDSTSFQLINPVVPELNRQTNIFNLPNEKRSSKWKMEA